LAAVASANVDLVRSIFAEWERGDLSSAEWADPEIELVIADGPHPGRSKGLAGIAETMRDFLRAWEDWRVAADEYRELDSERVLVLQHYSARGKTSGLPLAQGAAKGANLFHIRDGKVTRVVCYFERDRALADVGLAPEARPGGP